MVGEQPCPIKYHYINVFLVPFFVDMERESCSKQIDIVGITLCTSDTKQQLSIYVSVLKKKLNHYPGLQYRKAKEPTVKLNGLVKTVLTRRY